MEIFSRRKGWRGSSTKAGNARIRRVLIEAAWHYRVLPGCRPRPNKAVQARRAGQPNAVVALAEQADQRLHRRLTRLVARGKWPVLPATAVARELCGFLWAVMAGLLFVRALAPRRADHGSPRPSVLGRQR